MNKIEKEDIFKEEYLNVVREWRKGFANIIEQRKKEQEPGVTYVYTVNDHVEYSFTKTLLLGLRNQQSPQEIVQNIVSKLNKDFTPSKEGSRATSIRAFESVLWLINIRKDPNRYKLVDGVMVSLYGNHKMPKDYIIENYPLLQQAFLAYKQQ